MVVSSPVFKRPDKYVMALATDAVGTVYTAAFSGVAVSAAQDCFEVTCGSANALYLHEVRLGQYSDFGDAQAEILSVQVITGYTTSGSGGSTVTPAAVTSGTAGSSVEINNTTVANTGTAVVRISDTFNVAAGWFYSPSPSERILVPALGRLVVRITAPADALTMNGTIVFEEVPS